MPSPPPKKKTFEDNWRRQIILQKVATFLLHAILDLIMADIELPLLLITANDKLHADEW